VLVERQRRIGVAIASLGAMLLAAACGGGEDPAAASDATPTSGDASGAPGMATGTATAPAPTSAPDTTYTVQPGDTLYDLAIEWGTSVEAIVALNEITDANVLQVGQVLKKPPRGEQ